MERLTEDSVTGETYIKHCASSCPYDGDFCGTDECPVLNAVSDKLGEYERAEEQGLLVRLPCKVGDDVYIIPSPPIYGLNIFYGCENVNRVYHQHIESITFAGSHWYATGRNEYKEKVLNDTAFGTTWFLTREEAKKKLEEMKK